MKKGFSCNERGISRNEQTVLAAKKDFPIAKKFSPPRISRDAHLFAPKGFFRRVHTHKFLPASRILFASACLQVAQRAPCSLTMFVALTTCSPKSILTSCVSARRTASIVLADQISLGALRAPSPPNEHHAHCFRAYARRSASTLLAAFPPSEHVKLLAELSLRVFAAGVTASILLVACRHA